MTTAGKNKEQIDSEYEDVLNKLAEYYRTTPECEWEPDSHVAKKCGTNHNNCKRGKYMAKHGCTAAEARKAINLSNKALPMHQESMNGYRSLQFLTQCWRIAL